ncbi:hypothetical protein FXW78_39670 [Rhodococcus opacus]|nr:hypothetical protein [Rhodococcus opacus]
MSRSLYRFAGAYGSLKKRLPAGHPDLIAAERDLVAARLREHISEVLSESPALTAKHVESIVAVLHAAGEQ